MRESYQQRIHEQFPEVAYKRAELITKGWDCDVLWLDRTWVFRFPNRATRLAPFGAELAFLAEVARHLPLPVPNYQYVAEDGSFAGYRAIPGTELTPEAMALFDRQTKRAYAADLGRFITALHQLPSQSVAAAGFSVNPDDEWFGAENARRLARQVRREVFPILAPDLQKWIDKKFDAYCSLSFDFEPAVSHMDLVSDHLFHDSSQQRMTGIIDFGDTSVGDPALDFSGLWAFGAEFVDLVLQDYHRPIDRDFRRRAFLQHCLDDVRNMLWIAKGGQLPVSMGDCVDRMMKIVANESSRL